MPPQVDIQDNKTIYDNLKLTNKKKLIIECVVQNPDLSNETISERIGCSTDYSRTVRDEFEYIIKARSREIDSDSDKMKTRSWSSTTEKQKEVIKRISGESNISREKLNFDKIIDDLPFYTHESYIKITYDKYKHLIIKLKKAKIHMKDK